MHTLAPRSTLRTLKIRGLNISALKGSPLTLRTLKVFLCLTFVLKCAYGFVRGRGGRYADVVALVYPLRFAKEPL